MTCTINGQTGGPCPQYSFSSSINRITNTGFTYDAAGDLTSDGTNTYQYDAEGLMTGMNGGASSWAYNAEGLAAKTVVPWATSYNIFDLDRDGVGGYGNGAWQFVGRVKLGRRPSAVYLGNTWVMHVDALGSTTGDEYHWAAFGSDDPTGAPTRFRHYSLSEGRWYSPDPLGGDITNPQSLNRYVYVLNNPTTLTNPSGLTTCYDSNGNAYTCPDLDSGSTSVTVNGGSPPDINFFVFGVSGGCTFEPYLCESNYYFQLVSLASRTGTLAPPPKPKPPVHQTGCSAGNASSSSGQYFSGLESAATMLAEFLSGLGPDRLTFGPQSVESQMMSSSPGVTQAVNNYENKGSSASLYTFGLGGL